MIVRLSLSEGRYLQSAEFLAPELRQLLDAQKPSGMADESVEIALSRELAEEVRSSLTLRLAEVGFDAGYELTSEGRLLESLIDRLYRP